MKQNAKGKWVWKFIRCIEPRHPSLLMAQALDSSAASPVSVDRRRQESRQTQRTDKQLRYKRSPTAGTPLLPAGHMVHP
jgi:hypothetical protein